MVANFNKKANSEFFNNELLFKTVGVIFLVIIVVLIVADFKMHQRKKELALQVINFQKQIDSIEKNSQTLKEEIANFDNKDYLEKIGYEQFDQARQGETVYVFVKPQEKTETVTDKKSIWDIKILSGWLTNAWGWIKNKF